jgi:hypothetical protein
VDTTSSLVPVTPFCPSPRFKLPWRTVGASLILSPPWTPRYNISEPLPALSDALRSQCDSQVDTSDLTVRRRRLMINRLMSLSISSGPPSRGEDSEGKPGTWDNGVDPEAHQLQRDIQLRKDLLRLRMLELIKECRTSSLETTGFKFYLVPRLEEGGSVCT